MPDTMQKNKLLFDFYQNIKNGTEVLSIEDLEVAIKTMELAKEQLRLKEQRRICEANVRTNKKIPNGKVLYLPKNQKTLYANAFRGKEEIVKVVLNEGLKEIGEYAFAGCTNLREVVFPKNRISLRKGCFKDCISLKEVNIPDVANICPSAFENCFALKKISLPSTISNIYGKAFKNCRSLSQVNFEKKENNPWWGVVKVYSGVFENCVSLESMEIYNAYLANKAFVNCSSLKEVYNHYKWHNEIKFKKCNAKVIYL